MSNGAESGDRLPVEWARLERAAEDAALALGRWGRKSRDAEKELDALRKSIEELMSERAGSQKLIDEIDRLKTENSATQTRMLQARKRISGLMQKLAALELEP